MKRVGREAKIIGRNIRIMREAKGYSQKEIGKILKISFQQIQKYEAGSNRVPAEKLFLLQRLYGVPFSRFFDGLNADIGPLSGQKDLAETLLARIRAVGDDAFRERLYRAVSALIPGE